jgi:hypothetical protein
MNDLNYWKVYCNESRFPGLWRRWLKAQCLAVGYPPEWGFRFEGKGRVRPKDHRGWNRVRNALNRMKPGDRVVAQLPRNRVGRAGTIFERPSGDKWDPLVPERPDLEYVEMGRRIKVRWDLEVGPEDPDMVVELPRGARLGGNKIGTMSRIERSAFERICKAMQDEKNWVGLSTRFSYERALSDYIGWLPHRLADGLVPYPSQTVREKVFPDHSRSDVLLMDSEENPIVVECKKDAPNGASVHQLAGYLKLAQKETGKKPRGILVHGGSRKMTDELKREIRKLKRFRIDVVQYELSVHFTPTN